MLTAGERSHFETFGFMVRRKLFSSDEMDVISREFDDVLEEDRKGQAFKGDKRQAVLGCVEKRPGLLQLVDDDRIHGPIEEMLGPDFMWWGSDGNLYVGDTAWHSDASDIGLGYGRVKVAFYLDPVGKDTGCLRFIPGSHRLPLHDELRSLRYWRVKQAVDEGRSSSEALQPFLDEGLDPSESLFGADPSELPSYPAESRPGDVVFFNQHLYHGSFGGGVGRRMFTLNYYANPKTGEQVDLLRKQYESSVKNLQALAYTRRERVHEESFMRSERPRIKRMVAKLAELGFD